jgi:hypothetical protein
MFTLFGKIFAAATRTLGFIANCTFTYISTYRIQFSVSLTVFAVYSTIDSLSPEKERTDTYNRHKKAFYSPFHRGLAEENCLRNNSDLTPHDAYELYESAYKQCILSGEHLLFAVNIAIKAHTQTRKFKSLTNDQYECTTELKEVEKECKLE